MEVVDSIQKSKDGGLYKKIDFNKAYDSVEWSFIDFVLVKMGLGVKSRRWIKECVSTFSLSILVNGFPTESFNI